MRIATFCYCLLTYTYTIMKAYGCVYRGSIPGRIVLTTQGLQFRTSRVTGAKILVYYYWRDIISVRKSKSIDIFVWHTNGLDITTVDGEVRNNTYIYINCYISSSISHLVFEHNENNGLNKHYIILFYSNFTLIM